MNTKAKRIIATLLLAVAIASLCGCNGGEKPADVPANVETKKASDMGSGRQRTSDEGTRSGG